MSDTRAGDDDSTGTWTSETLPMHVRRELLERELRKLGFRKAGEHAASSSSPQQQQQQQQGGASSHPGGGGEHAD